MRFASRTDWDSLENELTAALAGLKAEGVRVIDLTVSNPTSCGLRFPSGKILEPLSCGQNLSYRPDPLGTLRAREAVAACYSAKGYRCAAEDIFLTASTSESYAFLFRLLCSAGEEVLVPAPSYPLFELLARICDVRLVPYPLRYSGAGGWRIDIDSLARGLPPAAKAVVLVNPNNPTGNFVHKDELSSLNDICRKGGLALICDEVFHEFLFEDKETPLSLLGNSAVPTFTMAGASKSLGLPQMKLAWTAASGPRDMIEEAMRRLSIILDTFLSVNTPVQNAIPEWLALLPEIRAVITRRVRQNREALERALGGAPAGMSLLKAEGGWYAVCSLPEALPEEDWAMDFLENARVFVHPGYFFDFPGGAHMVLSLLPPEDLFREGIDKVLARVRSRMS